MRRVFARVRALGVWLRRQPRWLTVPVGLALLALVALGTYQMANAYNYVQNNPNFCRACHIMEEAWDRWQTSEHQSVNCHECHESNIIEGARLLITFSLSRPERVGRHAVVQDGACEQCHESGDIRWAQVAATAGHRVHAEEQNIACTKCHSVTLHRFAPPGPICLVCHEDRPIEVSGMAAMHCTLCHDYLAEADQLLPARESCLSCHLALTGSGVTWPEDAPMRFPCGECHQPHVQAEPTVDCLACHSDVVSQGTHTVEAHDSLQCQACHQPHEWRIQPIPGESCFQCHEPLGPASVTPTPPPEETPVLAGPPPVPHSLEGRSECTACHGLSGIRPYPANHEGRTNETCLLCHQ